MGDQEDVLKQISERADIDTATLAALGWVTVGWNRTELALEMLIVQYLKVEGKIGMILTRPLGNLARCDVLLGLINELEPDPAVKDRIEFGCKLFNRNRENRNAIIHASCFPAEAGVEFVSRGRLPKPAAHRIEGQTDTVLRIASEIDTCMMYLCGISAHVWGREKAQPFALPDKPLLPDSVKKLPISHPNKKDPPRSSSA